MKTIRTLILIAVAASLSTYALASNESYDSETATVQKSDATHAKVMIGSKTYTAPIMFKDGATWDNVKDHYEVAPAAEAMLEKNKACICIGADGKASFMQSCK